MNSLVNILWIFSYPNYNSKHILFSTAHSLCGMTLLSLMQSNCEWQLNVYVQTCFNWVLKYHKNYQHIKACTCWGMKVFKDFQMGYENLKRNLDGL